MTTTSSGRCGLKLRRARARRTLVDRCNVATTGPLTGQAVTTLAVVPADDGFFAVVERGEEFLL
jgi:hypothetical protein